MKQTSEQASAHYTDDMVRVGAELMQQVKAWKPPVPNDIINTILHTWKTARAEAMAKYTAEVTGKETPVAQQQIFEADRQLYKDLTAGDDYTTAFGNWKKNTLLEKQGKFDTAAAEKAKAEKAKEAKAVKEASTSLASMKEIAGKQVIPEVVPAGFIRCFPSCKVRSVGRNQRICQGSYSSAETARR